MKMMNRNKILKNWILVLACCTLVAITIDILLSGYKDRESIVLEIEDGGRTEENEQEPVIRKSAFDSVRIEHLKSRGINPDSIINK